MHHDQGCRSAPAPALRRLPTYLRVLRAEQAQGRNGISCADIAEALGQEQTQVRKDLSLTGIVGRPRVGYDIAPLMAAIEAYLGWDRCTEAFLVGAGNLGSALLGYQGFQRCGLEIVAAFEADRMKVGDTIHGKPVFPLSKLTDLAKRMGVTLGVLSVPATWAQAVADRMVQAGLRGIWNFTPVRLYVPSNVVVEDVDLAASLAVLSHRLAARPQLAAAR